MPSDYSALARFLDRLLSHSRLDEAEQTAILGLSGHTEQTRANYDIVSPGETVDHACLIAHGLAGRLDRMLNGKRQITALYLPGDMCDLHSVVCPTAAWGIIALTTTTVLKVPHSHLRQLATAYPAIATAFWRDATVDASVLAKWVGNLGRRDAKSRIAHLLCETGLRMEERGLDTRTCFRFNLTQDQIADATGLTAVHVNRTLQALRGDETIRTTNHIVYVDDWNRLCRTAEFEPAYLLFNACAQGRDALNGEASDKHRQLAD